MRFDQYRFSRPRSWGLFGLSLFLFAFAGGCGGGKGNVSGTVTVDGKPLPMGNIVFTPAQGPSVAAEIHDGKYSAIGVPTGDVKISLDLTNLKLIADQSKPKTGVAGFGAKFGQGEDAAKQKSFNPGSKMNIPQEAKDQQKTSAEANQRAKEAIPLLKDIPEKYTDPNSSGWTLKVSIGDNSFDAKVTK